MSNLPAIVRLVQGSDGVARALDVARDYARQAKEQLLPLKPSPFSEALSAIADYVVDRRL